MLLCARVCNLRKAVVTDRSPPTIHIHTVTYVPPFMHREPVRGS